ncbi:dihydrolipoyllysine-residue acetyltransferase component 5 of pyruvate dehydrogenase complex, chloroplastic-like [Durio zibethinus]|uniref:Dihydrolipoyllysine-residue acetyltransferase component 5 of pyruvate dehydrogenase complex, chloroplastic-like n=1 Tax=Durio zibethinus TaxID=66656 RepID=A0A6P6B641_DURZI|nr:dihydrolipoyllysine-residue acetyltransferase component 5 of pyruvate dehydrogenase complex, chloroplastic-like [Durio zibethinus]
MHLASEGGKRIVVSPYVKKLANELKVDLGTVVGTGPIGRIVTDNVEATMAVSVMAASEHVLLPTSPAEVVWFELRTTVPFTKIEGAVSRNMVKNLSVPSCRVGHTITTNALDASSKKIKSKAITMTALLAKATILALVQHPIVNSSCRDGNRFTSNSSVSIVVVAIDDGLITPVLQDVDKVLVVLLFAAHHFT